MTDRARNLWVGVVNLAQWVKGLLAWSQPIMNEPRKLVLSRCDITVLNESFDGASPDMSQKPDFRSFHPVDSVRFGRCLLMDRRQRRHTHTMHSL